MDNPYQAPQPPILVLRRRPHVWPSIVSAVILCVVAIAMTIAFAWAAWYRLDHTEAMGRFLIPPAIPLYFIDGVLMASLLVGGVSGCLALWALVSALERWNRQYD